MSQKSTTLNKPAVNSEISSGAAQRHQIILAPETSERGRQLAIRDSRSFSNLIGVLINREYARLFSAPTAPAANLAEVGK